MRNLPSKGILSKLTYDKVELDISKIYNNFGTLIFSENNQNVIIVQTQHI